MMGEPTRLGGVRVLRRLVPVIGLFVILVPAMTRAQTNIDQGKSPAELFAGDCATCHKSARGLANGRASSALAGFLVEHYTASRDQAAALAAYVLGAGGNQPAPAAATQSRGPKAAPDKPERASVEEPKPSARSRDRTKREEAPATARARPPEEDKGGTPRIMQEPNGREQNAAPARRETEPTVAAPSHEATQEPTPPTAASPAPLVVTPAAPSPAPAVTPAPVAAAPTPAAGQESRAPAAAPGSSAAAPTTSDAGEAAPVERDNIPD
jgi:hypothetical protein